MKKHVQQDAASHEDGGRRSRWVWYLAGGGVLVILLAVLSQQHRENPTGNPASSETQRTAAGAIFPNVEGARPWARRLSSTAALAPTAEEVVTNKINQFAGNRR